MNVSSPFAVSSSETSYHQRTSYLILLAVIAAITAGFLAYALLRAFVWDEGFHLIAAQLMNQGKTPYLDFCFPQPPLNVYWNAAWMRAFGANWWVPHIPAALETAAAVFLTADFVFSRCPIPRWRLACAVCAAIFAGLCSITVEFGNVAQAYGIGMLLTVAAFRVTVAGVDRKNVLWPFSAGLLSGAAAGCTLLTAIAAPVLLIWSIARNRATRWRNACAFVAGIIVPFIPVILLFFRSPRQVWFNIVSYQAIYRRVNWNGATAHDVDVLLAWVDSVQALIIGLLAIAGFVFVARSHLFDSRRRAEFYLCGWLALLLAIYISTAHPTFERYYVVAVPFFGILAAMGVYAVASRFGNRPNLTTAMLACIFLAALGKNLFDLRDSETWQGYEQIAAQVRKVTPPNATLFSDELVYFLLHRTPPSGMEFSYSHKLQLPPAEERIYHIVSDAELKAQLKAGRFHTAQSCSDDQIDKLDMTSDFQHEADVQDCSVFWQPK